MHGVSVETPNIIIPRSTITSGHHGTLQRDGGQRGPRVSGKSTHYKLSVENVDVIYTK